jgi:type IV pilus assembly protein PilQ
MSKIWRPLGFAGLLAASLLITTSALRADSGPSVRITSAVGQGVVRLDAKANGPFEYKVLQPSANLYFIDLSGVSAAKSDAAQVLDTDLVRSYRLEDYQNNSKTVSRLEIMLGNGASPKIVRQGKNEIVIVVSKKGVLDADATRISAEKPSMVETALHSSEGVVASSPVSAIRDISVAMDGDAPEVMVLGTGSFNYRELRLSKPDRLVLDFPASRMSAPKKVTSDFAPIRDVRADQFSPQVARVVIDLSKAAPYTVKHVEGGVAVQFAAEAGSNSSPAAATAMPKDSSSQASSPAPSVPLASESARSISKPADSEADAASSKPLPSATPAMPPATTTDANSNADAGSKPSPAIAAPETAATSPKGDNDPAQDKLAAPAADVIPPAAKQAEPVSSNPPSPIVMPVSTPEQQQTSTAQSSTLPASPAPVNVAAPADSAPISPMSVMSQDSQGVKYTGAPISVNLKDVDLQDFFRLIHEISGLNVVVDPSVKGTLTIVLDNVPWDQALDIVLKNNDLDKQLEGNVLRIASKATLKKEAEENRELAKAQAEAADVVTTTRVLSYAKATDLVATLKTFLSARGEILADNRTNTLVISDIPSVFPVIDNLLRELDKRSRQVEIEARVVAANRSFSRELGSQFAFAGSATSGRSVFGGNPSVGTSSVVRNSPPLPVPPLISSGSSSGSSTASSLPLNTNLGATVATSGVAYAFSSANFALDYLISAAEAKGVGKLLSKPSLVTQNNIQSSVEQGTKIPIQTVINNTISVQFVDAVLQLKVTPQITADNTIFLNIHVENTQIDPSIPRVNGIPALDTQAEDTQVIVNDGATIMVGGIIISNQQTAIQEVPYVGSIPIIGRLFQHRTVSTQSQELLFFITPRILPS